MSNVNTVVTLQMRLTVSQFKTDNLELDYFILFYFILSDVF